MSNYKNPAQLWAAVETANAMSQLSQQYSPEELSAMGFDMSSHADPDPKRPFAHLVAAEMLRHAHDLTAGTPLGKILFDEHHRGAGLLTEEELANAPMASLEAAELVASYEGALALEAGAVEIDSVIGQSVVEST